MRELALGNRILISLKNDDVEGGLKGGVSGSGGDRVGEMDRMQA